MREDTMVHYDVWTLVTNTKGAKGTMGKIYTNPNKVFKVVIDYRGFLAEAVFASFSDADSFCTYIEKKCDELE